MCRCLDVLDPLSNTQQQQKTKTTRTPFGLFTSLPYHKKCETSRTIHSSNKDAPTAPLGNVERTAVPESGLWAPMKKLRSRRSLRTYTVFGVLAIFTRNQTNKYSTGKCDRAQPTSNSPSSGMGLVMVLGTLPPVRVVLYYYCSTVGVNRWWDQMLGRVVRREMLLCYCRC